MKRFVVGQDRSQSTLFPERLDDFITDENPVRAIDAFVDELDLAALGFDGVLAAETGRPSYHPSTLLKIYIYGYLNRVQSSRRLEREAQRNLELIWLTSRLAPDFKTIADFRKDNGPAIRRVCSQFVVLCRRLNLLSDGVIAIDGSKFKAVNNRDRNRTVHKLRSRMEHMEHSVGRYLDELDRADRISIPLAPDRVTHLQQKIATIRAHMKQLASWGEQLASAPDQQISMTDPDSRSMVTKGRGTGMVGYNVQTAVESQHHLIVAHEVTNDCSDRLHLVSMANLARDATGQVNPTVLADRGYYKGEEILQCERQGIAALVPKPLTSNSKAEGRFDKRDFVYVPEVDEYRCPAGERAIHRFVSVENGMRNHKYWSSACPRCPIKAHCTPSDYRRISRWEHEAVLDAMQARLDRMPDASRLRRQTVEHPYATLKAWMGATHFRTRTLPRVSTEMSLHELAYNMKRVLQILGVQPLIQAMRA